MPLIDIPTFEGWIVHIFDHPKDDPGWFKHPRSPLWPDHREEKAHYIARTFEEGDQVLAPYPARKVRNGIGTIFIESDYIRDALHVSVPFEARRRVVRSTFDLFVKVVAVRFADADVESAFLDDLWNRLWTWYPDGDDLWDEKLAMLERLLTLGSPLCRWSAAYGLNLAWSRRRADVERIIDAHLSRPEASKAVAEELRSARKGLLSW